MIKSPRYLHAATPTRPYKHQFNVASVYDNNVTTCEQLDELTDEQIEALIDSSPDDLTSDLNIFPELSGDDYADAVLADLGL